MKEYLLAIISLSAVFLFLCFFICSTAMAVYLKIFIQKRSNSKDFIVSKYTGGISGWQFKRMRWIYIIYDFFMLSVLSLLSYLMPAIILLNTLLGFDGNPYQVIGLYLFLIFLFVILIPIDEIKNITRLKWSLPGAPGGMIMIWREGSKFGYIYNFIYNPFIYLLLFLFIFFLALAIL